MSIKKHEVLEMKDKKHKQEGDSYLVVLGYC
jgi:hypothetical protein